MQSADQQGHPGAQPYSCLAIFGNGPGNPPQRLYSYHRQPDFSQPGPWSVYYDLPAAPVAQLRPQTPSMMLSHEDPRAHCVICALCQQPFLTSFCGQYPECLRCQQHLAEGLAAVKALMLGTQSGGEDVEDLEDDDDDDDDDDSVSTVDPEADAMEAEQRELFLPSLQNGGAQVQQRYGQVPNANSSNDKSSSSVLLLPSSYIDVRSSDDGESVSTIPQDGHSESFDESDFNYLHDREDHQNGYNNMSDASQEQQQPPLMAMALAKVTPPSTQADHCSETAQYEQTESPDIVETRQQAVLQQAQAHSFAVGDPVTIEYDGEWFSGAVQRSTVFGGGYRVSFDLDQTTAIIRASEVPMRLKPRILMRRERRLSASISSSRALPMSPISKNAANGQDRDDISAYSLSPLSSPSSSSSTSSSSSSSTISTADVHVSKYIGVTWNHSYQMWRAMIGINSSNTHLGYFDSEVEAAKKFDEKAATMGRSVNFPDPDAQPPQKQAIKMRADKAARVKNAASKYTGVSWAFARQIWIAQICINSTRIYLGHSDSEVEAAILFDEKAAAMGRPVNFPDPDAQPPQEQAIKRRAR